MCVEMASTEGRRDTLERAQPRLQLMRCVLHPSIQSQLCQNYPTASRHEIIYTNPKVSLFDDKVHVKVQGLPGNVKVTVHAALENQWQKKAVKFVSCGHFVTDSSGNVDLLKDASQGGTYSGVEPMGLFLSLQPSPSGPGNIRLVLKDVDQPCLYILSVYSGHLSLNDLHATASGATHQPLATTVLTRLIKAANVRRVPVREGRIRGTLFLPPGDGPHQGVIDLFGMAGGLMETRGAMLASRGFATLSLAFFRYDDLPPTVQDIQFDYFEEAAQWLSFHPQVCDGGIGVVAVSGGAVLASLIAWKCPAEVAACVLINGPPFYPFGNLYRKGELFYRGIMLDRTRTPMTEEGMITKPGYPYTLADFIPVWESSAHILLLISEDDEQIEPELGKMLIDMYPESKRHLIEEVRYPGAGHLLEPPYTPHCRSCFNPPFGFDLLWGGRCIEHARAQEQSWQKIISFLRTHLP